MADTKPKEFLSIFQTLKYAGENFFENREILKSVREECDNTCVAYQDKFKQLQSEKKSTTPSVVNEILFRKLNIQKPEEFDYEKREDITKEELAILREECKKKSISDREIESIKYSLGYKSDKAVYKKPCVAIVGQTKAGKSSLINCILQERIVPQKVMRQTARVTYVTHSTTKFVAHMQNSKLIKIDINTDVSDEDVDLKFQDRNKKGVISVEIRVGTTNPIVQNGFDIVDSPGLNENPALNTLCAKMEKSLLPLLIYVIEGRNGLTQTDIDDIKLIRLRTPQLRILYFVTKLARSKYDRLMYIDKKTKKGFGKNEDMPGESDKEVANRRLNNVLKKMKIQTFIPLSTDVFTTRDFHGADIWAVNEMRIHNQSNERSECDDYNWKLMGWFEENLMLYLKEMLESPLKDEIQYIQSPLEDVLEKTTSVASDIATEKQDKQKSLELFEKYEQELYDDELEYIEKTLRIVVDRMIKESKERLPNMIDEFVQDSLPKGRSKDAGDSVTAQLIDDIKRKVEESLDEEIKKFVTKFMVEKEERLRTNLCRILKLLTKGNFGSKSFEIMLRNRLLYEYDFNDCIVENDLSSEFSSKCEISYNSKSVKRIMQLVKDKGHMTASLFKKRKPDEANQREAKETKTKTDKKDWKQNLIEDVVNDFDRDKFMKAMCDMVTDDFKKRHEKFVTQLKEQDTFLHSNLTVGLEEKKFVKEFAEEMGVQFARALHVKTPINVMVNPLLPTTKLAKGGQASVDLVKLIDKKKPIVIKYYRQTFRDFTSSERLKKIAMEIYYSSRLNYPHCLELLGIHFEATPEGYRFSAYYPYLEKGTLKNFLRRKTPSTDESSVKKNLKERLELCIEVAEGIHFLHLKQIVHRDINLKNILVRYKPSPGKISDFEAVISDYGLTKSFGFIEHTDKVGTPLYMAPELFNKKGLVREGYSLSIDVFSFGICAWQLLSYNLTDQYGNYYPKFAIDCEHDQETVEKLVIDGSRPEERPKIPSQLDCLLKKCWNFDPNKRPSFIKTLHEMPIDFCPNDPMIDKTIIDVLKDVQKKI